MILSFPGFLEWPSWGRSGLEAFMRLQPSCALVHLSIEGLTGAEKFTSVVMAFHMACKLVLVVGGNL